MKAALDTAEGDLERQIVDFLAERLEAKRWTKTQFWRSVEGFSWETYQVGLDWTASDGDHSGGFIVHRVPSAGLLRPYRPRALFELRSSIGALTTVPIPATLWLDEDGTATGRPLYVVERVVGDVPTQWSSDGFFSDDSQRTQIADQLMEITAILHAAPLTLAPSGIRGASEQDALAEVRYWYDIYMNEDLGPEPILDYGFAWLFANSQDVSGRLAVLHGDLRTGNYMVRDGRIVALLDWEESHVGDPVQDLAHCALRLFRGRTRQPSGLVPLNELLAAYERAAGWEVPQAAFHYWTVFEAVYTAITQHRAAAIFAAGETDDVRYAALGSQVHYNHRFVIDAIESAELGEVPK